MTLAFESPVRERYARGAVALEPQLCCPVDYDPRYLAVIPDEVLERDYGCGDPSRHLRPGETVLDLGSGTGKICFIASQVVGREGRVIGIDMTPEMLAVARRAAPVVAGRLGFANVELRRGRIQDLALDLDRLDAELAARPISSVDALLEVEELAARLRREAPLVADSSVDVVVSNCVLNLVGTEAKGRLFGEIFRVLRRGGRAVISDIVSDEPVPPHLQADPELWSGCVSGALTEEGFLAAFEQAGFHGIRILERPPSPWRTVEGIELRSLTVEAFKGKQGPCFEHLQAVIYKGSFKEVLDDDLMATLVLALAALLAFANGANDNSKGVATWRERSTGARAGWSASRGWNDTPKIAALALVALPAGSDSRGAYLFAADTNAEEATFAAKLRSHGVESLTRGGVTTLQVNVGRLCNLACHHCHVEAGPKRTESLSSEVADRLLELLASSPRVELLDLTGGAPEMNREFRRLVEKARQMGRRVIDRCNLSILLQPGYEDLAPFLAAEQVEVVASLPCYTLENVDQQRGRGTFDASIEALRRLNRLGYGQPGSPLRLDLVYNPLGPSLPPEQARLEVDYKRELARHFGIEFHRLLTITNMPIRRFAEQLVRLGKREAYQALLVNHFNPATVGGLMCRTQASVDWNGRLYDCDFNLMLDLPMPSGATRTPRTIWDLASLEELEGGSIATASHCFGCTAGSGSSCSGALG